ncbi:MAG: flagellar hook-length control protein FliK [Thermodesulfobacteriota bacterium]
MSIMMNPVLPVAAPELPATNSTRGRQGVERSFADHLDQRIEEKMGGKRDKLGVGRPEQREPVGEKRQAGRDEGRPQKSADPSASDRQQSAADLAAILADMMDFLKDVAQSTLEVPGEWQVELTDDGFLQQFALAAGMDEADFAQFVQQMGEADGPVRLVDMLTALSNHFAEQETEAAITVPETEWPLLETLLARMGVSREALDAISARATTGDGAINLDLLLQGLKEAGAGEDLSLVTLSDWEAEQLQNLLAQAGVTLEEQNELLPERFLNQVLGREGADRSVAMSMERLTAMLNDALTGVRDSQPKIDLPAFLANLQQVMATAEFQNQGVGWTPVIEESVNAVFQQLQEIVDLSRIRIEEAQAAEEQLLNEDVAEWFKKVEEKFAELANRDPGGDPAGNNGAAGQTAEESGNLQAPASQRANGNLVVSQSSHDVAQAAETARSEAGPRTPQRPLPQQHVFQQLSDGVVRGLRNQEHQLVLRLYPQELGEVKVNLLVRDEHVSVSFSMENARVKEMLESSMEEFKQSLDQKGFKLGECFVSVGQQDDGGSELWQRFALARDAVRAARATLADVPDNALYLRADAGTGPSGRPDGISLFV